MSPEAPGRDQDAPGAGDGASAARAGGIGPLAGVRVVELAGIGPGPFAGMLLADLGAEVVVVERPADPATTVLGATMRRGKRSIVVDLRKDGAAEVVLELVRDADIVFEGWRPGVAERLGVGPDDCLAVNPAVVYGRMTGWGQDGPLAATAGHDINYLALSGALHAIGTDRPTPPLNLVADYGGGSMFLLTGVLAGLVQARATGRGSVVDAAMYDGVNALMTMFWELHGAGQHRDGRDRNVLDGGAPFNTTYRCADGRWIAVGALEPHFRARLLERLGIPFDDADLGLDRAAWPGLRERLTARFAERDRDDWVAHLDGLDVCVTPVLSLAEAPHHPHAVARGAFRPAGDAPGVRPAPAPRVTAWGAAGDASASPSGVDPGEADDGRAPGSAVPPPPGRDTDDLLAAAGLSAGRIARLRADGVVG
ncbi:CaiB/BaiF CoA-transferase family protein [Patulibacter sp.]|uniref:CaiB/BaiF CoA transferase family protein n=1 Tax=Patulibacter sp. TaxID=1912859 RepID=UPI00271A8860|nr:CaiB/BaiF CoA-transferase family protein [Patulibacter sp.]MDO9408038.1 CaiB/BaiF CoA-transferase family protein [Patulibacter sp.]